MGSRGIVLPAMLLLIPLALGMGIVCPSTPVNTTANVLKFELNVTTDANADGNILLIDLNTPIGEYNASTALSNGIQENNEYVYTVHVNIDLGGSFDGNVTVTGMIGNDVNRCSFFAFDLPHIVLHPDANVITSKTIHITCRDFSGCRISEVRIDENVMGPFGSEVNVALPEGNVPLFVSAVDEYNFEGNVSRQLVVDYTPPAMDGPYLAASEGGYALRFSARDEITGILGYSVRVDNIYYCESFGEGNCTQIYSDGTYTVMLPGEISKGRHDITVKVFDRAGNMTEGNTVLTVIDPATLTAVEGPFILGREGNNGWFVSPVQTWYRPISDTVCVLNGRDPLSTEPSTISTEGDNYISCGSGENNVTVYVPIDLSPPSIGGISYAFSPGITVSADINDAISGVAEVITCVDTNCAPLGTPLPLPDDGGHVLRVIAWDRAGNMAEKNVIVEVNRSAFVTDLNAPSVSKTGTVEVHWASGKYIGPFTVYVDSNTYDVNGHEYNAELPAGWHTVCVEAKDIPESRKCERVAVDLAPPHVELVVPERSLGTSFKAEWRVHDDTNVVSVKMIVDGHTYGVDSEGSREFDVGYGTHTACIRAVDIAGRTAEVCREIILVKPKPRSAPSLAPTPAPPEKKEDKWTVILKNILKKEGIRYVAIKELDTQRGRGIPEGTTSIVSRISNEFNIYAVPIPSEWTVVTFSIDGNTYTLVYREYDTKIKRIYEYFAKRTWIASPYITNIQYGSMLVTFEINGEQYYYVVKGKEIGIPLEVKRAAKPTSVVKKPENLEKTGTAKNIRNPTEGAQISGEHRQVPKSAVTPYAVLAPDTRREIIAGALILLGLLALALASIIR